MYARIVNMKLKKDTHIEDAKPFKNEVFPVIRKQDGFRDEISLIAPESSEVTGITFWKMRKSADEYNRTMHPQILKSPSNVDRANSGIEEF
jgi:hypothetical protein